MKALLASSTALAAGIAAPAYAQDAQSAQSPTDQSQPEGAATQNGSRAAPGTAIVVTGFRQSIEKSLREKRNANAIVDVINAEDIGKFPDKNVADALQRVPGVVIERSGGEGKYVSVRGLAPTLTLTELNGNYVAPADTGDPSRSFNYVMLPSNMIASVEVFKSSEARLDEGGIGGTVELHTRRPLDLPSLSGFIDVEGTDSDTTRKVEPQISGLISWKNQAETFGILLGATYQKRTDREMDGSTESWRWWTDDRSAQPATDIHGQPYANDDQIAYWWGGGATTQSGQHYSGYWVPQSVDTAVLTQDRKRLGLQATAQWKPTDNLLITVNAFRFQLNQNTTQNMLKIPEWGYGNFFTSATFDPSGTIQQSANFQVTPAQAASGLTMETPQINGTISKERDVSTTFDGHIDYTSDAFDMNVALGHTKATGGPSEVFHAAFKPRLVTSTSAVNGNTISTWDFSSGVPVETFSPDIVQNLQAGIAQLDGGSTNSSMINASDEQTYFQADGNWHAHGALGFLDGIQFGVKYRTGGVHRQTFNTEWVVPGGNINDSSTWFQSVAPYNSYAQASFFYPQSLGNIDGNAFHANVFPAVNMQNYLDWLNQTFGPAQRRTENNFIWNVNESIWAGYAQANFRTDRFRGNLGVRIVDTKEESDSTDQINYNWRYYVPGTGQGIDVGTAPCTVDPTSGLCEVLPGTVQQTQVTQTDTTVRHYLNVLPSFNGTFELRPNLLLRAAIAKVISRPEFSDLGGQQQLNYNGPGWEADRQQYGDQPGWSGGGGNKNLKPYSALQFDAGIEWYFHPGSVIGMDLFRKNVSDFIVPLVINTSITLATNQAGNPPTIPAGIGTPVGSPFPYTPPVGAASDIGSNVLVQSFSTSGNGTHAVSQGVELYAQHTFPIGIGFLANFTYNDTNLADVNFNGQKIGTSPLVGSAKTQINVSVFYENKLFSLRASYNRRGSEVEGLVSGLNVVSDPYQQIDLNGSLNITKHLLLTASAINVTGESERQHLGLDTTKRYYSSVYAGRRFYAGVTYKFGDVGSPPPPPPPPAPPPLPPATQTCADGTVVATTSACPVAPPPPAPPAPPAPERG
jgi:TonB-dependent receptor